MNIYDHIIAKRGLCYKICITLIILNDLNCLKDDFKPKNISSPAHLRGLISQRVNAE